MGSEKTKSSIDMHSRVVTICEGAVMAAMALGLSYLKFKLFPTGGSIDVVMVPLLVLSIRRGAGWGIGASLVFGTLKCIMSEGIAYGWHAMIMDYSLAYAMVGLAGFFRSNITLAVTVGTLGRYIVHVISGVALWGQWMPDEFLGITMTNTLVYSLIYNATFMIPSFIIALALVLLISKKTKLLSV